MQFTAQSLNSGFLGMAGAARSLRHRERRGTHGRDPRLRRAGGHRRRSGDHRNEQRRTCRPRRGVHHGREQRRLLRATAIERVVNAGRYRTPVSRRHGALGPSAPRWRPRRRSRCRASCTPAAPDRRDRPKRRHADDRRDGHARTDPDVAGRVEHPSDNRGVRWATRSEWERVLDLARRQTAVRQSASRWPATSRSPSTGSTRVVLSPRLPPSWCDAPSPHRRRQNLPTSRVAARRRTTIGAVVAPALVWAGDLTDN